MSFTGYDGYQVPPHQMNENSGQSIPGAPMSNPQNQLMDQQSQGQYPPPGGPMMHYLGGPVIQQQQQNPSDGSDTDPKTTLWMGELEPWIDELFVRNFWLSKGEQVNVKLIRDKLTGSNAGYCFIDFQSTQAAAQALTLSGMTIPNSNRPLKLNWASGGGVTEHGGEDRGPEFSIFVGDLSPDVTEDVLRTLFSGKYPSFKAAKIMTDPITRQSRGYGFVRFSDLGEQQRAMSEMEGVYCGNRPMRVSTATPKNKGAPVPNMNLYPTLPMGMHHNPQAMGGPPMQYYGNQHQQQPMNQFTDPNNTTVFVGGLSGYVTEDELRSFFQGFGEITYVKIPPGKGCGFVQFVQRHAAELAINQMQGYPIGNSRVRLSWGRSQSNSGPAGTPYRPVAPPPNYQSMGGPPYIPHGHFAPLK